MVLALRAPGRENPALMFTGLVEGKARVRRVERRGGGMRLCLEPQVPGFQAELGQSLSVSGACLSVAARPGPGELAFDLSPETLARTWFGALREGVELNLERALRLGDRLDGHLVSGHVDAVGLVLERRSTDDGGAWMEFEVPAGFERWLVDKGSVTVDGVSLTVVDPSARRFAVALIPLTLAGTTLGSASAGTPVNLEADSIGKWVERLLGPRAR